MNNLLKDIDQIVYVFQGGGALGAYQVGIYEALTEEKIEPNWVIGTSIGAINAAIIAGNEPHQRLERLQEFWSILSHNVGFGLEPENQESRKWLNYISAQYALFFGKNGFFHPKLNNPFFETNGSADTISFYSTKPLKNTLKNLIDFDLLNSQKVRVTLGAVEVQKGNIVFFDSSRDRIEAEHIMASCALPPGFPAVRINDEYYWDGGVLSNTPVQALLHDKKHRNTLCFMANLFDSYGLNPKTLDEVLKRHKDLMYSSQDHMHLQMFKEQIKLKRELNYLYEMLPKELKDDPKIIRVHQTDCSDAQMHFVRFMYAAPPTELSSKDYEFSQRSIQERIEAGRIDGKHAVAEAPWLEPVPEESGVAIYEICAHPSVCTPWEEL